jgi:hypothetical protein
MLKNSIVPFDPQIKSNLHSSADSATEQVMLHSLNRLLEWVYPQTSHDSRYRKAHGLFLKEASPYWDDVSKEIDASVESDSFDQ